MSRSEELPVPSRPIGANDDAGTWSITTPALALRWERDESGEVRLVSIRSAGREWIASPRSMFSTYGYPEDGSPFVDVASSVDASTLRLTGTHAPSGLTVTVTLTVFEADSVVVVDLEAINDGDAANVLGSLSSLHFATARDGAARLGVLAGGRWDASLPPRGYGLQLHGLDEIGRGTSFGAAADGRSSGEHVPWFALTQAGGGVLAALAWSGRWALDVVPGDDDNVIAFGIADFSHRLEPGARVPLPSVVLSGFAGDLDDGANAWRRWASQRWTPPVPEGWPWIQYNHWYAYYGDIDAARLLEEARLAAGAGCEVFVIDDGWFRGRRPDSYVAGWGDWVEDRSKFPDGIHAFGERVRELGMRFGLWVEPERADEAGELVRQHPGWVMQREGEPIRRSGPGGAEGVHLCLGNPEVRRWMRDEMVRVVREYGVDWLKWDYNMGYGLGCDAPDHGHQATDGHHAHTLGLYQVLGELRAACPELVIENCASGGHRVDLGTLRHSHTNWVSDYTHRAASCRQHAQGAGLFLPLAHVNTWALGERDATGFRSRMGGAFGISSFMGDWLADERAAFGRAVAEYTHLRPFLAGDRHLLTGPWHNDWDIWQLTHPSGDAFVLLAFHERGAVGEVWVHPRLPSVERSYAIQRAEEAAVERSGAELASDGVTIRLRPGASEIITVTVS